MDKKELLTEAQKRHNMNAAAIVEYIETFSDPFSFVETNKFLTYSDSSDEMTDAVITGYATIEGRQACGGCRSEFGCKTGMFFQGHYS